MTKLRNVLTALASAAVLMLYGAGPDSAYRPVTLGDLEELQLPAVSFYRFDTGGWKFKKGDDPQYAAAGYDDSGWAEVEVNSSLRSQKSAGNVAAGDIVWYRKTFTLPEGAPLTGIEFLPGYISAGDTVYLNGRECASTPHRGATVKFRSYLLTGPEAFLKPGENVLAIRVTLANAFGMYMGIPELRKLELPRIAGVPAHTTPGRNISLTRHVSSRRELNHFAPSDRIIVRPRLALLNGTAPLSGKLTAVLNSGSGKKLHEVSRQAELRHMAWLEIPPLEFPNPGAGDYLLEVRFESGGQTVWRQQFPLTVAEIKPLEIPVDEGLRRYLDAPLPLELNEASFGSYGPATINANGELVDDYSRPESRAAAAVTVGINKRFNGPALLHTHVRPVPGKWRIDDWSSAPGSQYDGLGNAWPAGTVSPPAPAKVKDITTAAIGWTSKTVNWHYDSGNLQVTMSLLNPALQISTDLSSLRLFAGNRTWQTPGPQALYLEKNGKWLKSERITEFPQNYLLVTFAGPGGKQEFDIPYLLVFRGKPRLAALNNNALELQFPPGSQPVFWLMPLYGVTLQEPRVPGETDLQRCRFFARRIPAFPTAVSRTGQVNYDDDCVLIRDEFKYDLRPDAWGTEFIRSAPLPPVLALVPGSELNVAVSGQALDYSYATLGGPLLAFENTAAYCFRIDKSAHFVTEVREVTDIPDTPVNRERMDRIEELTRKLLPELNRHPWAYYRRSGGKVFSGGLEPQFSNLLLAQRFTAPPTAQAVYEACRREVRAGLMNDELPITGSGNKKRTINTVVVNPVSGKRLTTNTRHAANYGIDGPCWEGLRIYAAWDYAHTVSDPGFLSEYRGKITESYDLIVNSMDWRYAVSFDSFAGLRVGNGLQESTIFHAAFAAYARIMHMLGDTRERDRAACYSVIQLTGIVACVNPRTGDYLRRTRPYLPEHSDAAEIEKSERIRPHHHYEFNERGGFFHSIMFHHTSLYAHRWIMSMLPEIMRPFRDLWGDFTNAHYRPELFAGRELEQPPPVDTYVYMTPDPPVPPEELFRRRQEIRPKPEFIEITDLRAVIESTGKVSYRKLW